MKHKHRTLIVGTGRSGTTAIYSLLQKIYSRISPEDTDYVYEPFLWNRSALNGEYEKVKNQFRFISSLSYDGIFFNKEIPLFCDDASQISGTAREWLEKTLSLSEGKSNYLGKMIRACGRLELICNTVEDLKIIYVLRNPIDVINSSIKMFSFYGDEFYESDDSRFEHECKQKYGVDCELDDPNKLEVLRQYEYWYYQNRAVVEFSRENPDRVLTVSYEEYVNNSAETIKDICHFIGIDYDEKYSAQSRQKIGPISGKGSNISEDEFICLSKRWERV